MVARPSATSARRAGLGKLDGHCGCGSITYSCDAEPVTTAVCHCTECQRQTGTAFSIVVGVPGDALEVRGETLAMVKTVGGGGWRRDRAQLLLGVRVAGLLTELEPA